MHFINKKVFSALIIITATFLVLINASLLAAQPYESARPNDPQTALAEVYSRHYGVTVEEALRRLEIQDSFPELQPALEQNEIDTFGGLWIQHEPEYKIVVAFTQDGTKTISEYSDYISETVAPYVEVRTVDKSLAELLQEQAGMRESLNEHAISSESRVDVRNNVVDIDIPQNDKTAFYVEEQAGSLTMPENVKINFVERLSVLTTDLYGGLSLDYYGGSPCATSGFAVHKSSTGEDGVITVAHAYDYLYYNGTSLDFKGGVSGGSYDVQWHSKSSLSFPNRIQWWSDGSTFNITSTKTRSQLSVGAVVSKYGITTQYTAGEITSTTFDGTWIEVDNVYGYYHLAEEGDSGGPWFNGNIALGITHSRSADYQKAYFMALDYLDLLGVTVKTS